MSSKPAALIFRHILLQILLSSQPASLVSSRQQAYASTQGGGETSCTAKSQQQSLGKIFVVSTPSVRESQL